MPNLHDKKYIIMSFSGVLCDSKRIQTNKTIELNRIQKIYQESGVSIPTKDEIQLRIQAGLRTAHIFEQLSKPNSDLLFKHYRALLE